MTHGNRTRSLRNPWAGMWRYPAVTRKMIEYIHIRDWRP